MKLRCLILIVCCGAFSYVAAQSPSEEIIRRAVRRNVWVSEYEPNDSEKNLLAPAIEDKERCESFLRLPETGLIKRADVLVGLRVMKMEA